MSLIGNLVRAGIKSADDLARQVMPAVLQTGDSVLVQRTTDALRKMGAQVPSQPGPGLLGTRQASSAARPAPSQLPESIRGLVGPSPTPRPARAAAPSTPAPGVRGVPALAQNRPPVPLAEAPTPPVRYPAPAPASETARQITMLKPGSDEVGSMGTRLTYRPGTQGIDGRLGSTTYGQSAEVGASSIYPRTGPSAADLMQRRAAGVVEEAGTPLFPRGTVEPYTAPRAAFGPGAGPSSVDRITDLAFGGRGAGNAGGALTRQGGPGGALVRSPGGEMVDELMIDPVRVREIFEGSPELLGSLRNAAGGIQTADLGSLLSNPAVRAAIGAGGLGALGLGIAGMFNTDRTGETTAGAPPSLPLTTPMFTEVDGSPLGAAAPGVLTPPNPPAPGNIDPTAPAPVVTGGGLEQESAVRTALAQNAPGAAAVMRASEPMSPERYGSIEDYYAARAAYAGSADKRRELMRFMEGQSQTLGAGLAQWAEANPALAYEFQRRQLANPAANQQSAESITKTTVTTPMGSETAANAVGNAEATAQAAVDSNQAAVEMREATRMQVQPNLQRVQEFIRTQAPRSAMYAGY